MVLISPCEYTVFTYYLQNIKIELKICTLTGIQHLEAFKGKVKERQNKLLGNPTKKNGT